MADDDLAILLEPHSPTVREVFVALRRLVREVMPDAVEQLDLPTGCLHSASARPAASA